MSKKKSKKRGKLNISAGGDLDIPEVVLGNKTTTIITTVVGTARKKPITSSDYLDLLTDDGKAVLTWGVSFSEHSDNDILRLALSIAGILEQLATEPSRLAEAKQKLALLHELMAKLGAQNCPPEGAKLWVE